MWDRAMQGRGGGIYIGNNDHCNLDFNATPDIYSDNVWTIFNEIYDVQTGVSMDQQVHCSGGIGCCPGFGTECCSDQASCYNGPNYGNSRMYVVGNVFHHIFPFCCAPAAVENPSCVDPDCENPQCGDPCCTNPCCDDIFCEDPCCELPCCNPGDFGQAVLVGAQGQVRVVNNTIFECAQGLQILCTDSIGPCPPNGDTNGVEGITRNTSVVMVNNVILDTPDDGTNDSHVRVCTGRDAPPNDNPATLVEDVEGEAPIPGFGHNVHFGTYRMFQIPSGPFFSVQNLRDDDFTIYGTGSWGDFASHNPNLDNPAHLSFDLRLTIPVSPSFMFTGGFKDAAYNTFVALTAPNQPFAGFPSIYHDYDGHAHPVNPESTCPIGAFGN